MLLLVAPGLAIAALVGGRAPDPGRGGDAVPPAAPAASRPAVVAAVPAILAPPGGTADRPGADTTDGPPPVRHLAGAAGGDHRWFVGLRTQGAGGYGIGHQAPEMPAARHRVVSIVRQPPDHLVALGPRAWVIAPPLAPGTARPVYAIELRRNPVHAVWYPVGTTPLAPQPRLPAGVRPLLAAAEPTGPVVIAPPAEPGGPHRVLRLGLDRWSERPLGSPRDVPADQLAAEVPIALAVVRAPRAVAAAAVEAGQDATSTPVGAPAGSAAEAPEPPGDEGSDSDSDSGPGSGRGSGSGSGAAAAADDDDGSDPPPPGPPTADAATMTMLLVAGPDALAVDLVGRSGERRRVWSGLPEVAAARWAARGPRTTPSVGEPRAAPADGEAGAASAAPGAADATSPRGFDAAILDVAGEPWIALREATGITFRRLESPETPVVVAGVREDEPVAAALGGDGALLLAGDALDDPDRPARVRAWTPGGTEEADGPLAAEQVDAGRILRGPIIIGTGIFFAVIAGVLGSRPGARPEAIEGREAGVPRRLGAALVDALAPLAAGALVFGWTPDALLASLLLLHPGGYLPWAGLTVLWAFATVVGDVSGGRTPGRLVFGVRPVDVDGRPPSRGRLIVRFLVRTVAVAFPPLVLFWLAHARGRALHDLVAGTWVVRVDGSGGAAGAGPPSRR